MAIRQAVPQQAAPTTQALNATAPALIPAAITTGTVTVIAIPAQSVAARAPARNARKGIAIATHHRPRAQAGRAAAVPSVDAIKITAARAPSAASAAACANGMITRMMCAGQAPSASKRTAAMRMMVTSQRLRATQSEVHLQEPRVNALNASVLSIAIGLRRPVRQGIAIIRLIGAILPTVVSWRKRICATTRMDNARLAVEATMLWRIVALTSLAALQRPASRASPQVQIPAIAAMTTGRQQRIAPMNVDTQNVRVRRCVIPTRATSMIPPLLISLPTRSR